MGSTKIVISDFIKKNKTSTLILQVIRHRKPLKITLPVNVENEYWNNESCRIKRSHPKYKEKFKEVNKYLNEIETKADDLLIELNRSNSNWTLLDFKNRFENSNHSNSLVEQINIHIEILIKTKKLGTADIYKAIRYWIIRFQKNMVLEDVNENNLNKLSEMMQTEIKPVTIAMYFRSLRALFNLCKNNDLVNENLTPFKKFKISKLKSDIQVKALTANQVKKIIDYKVEIGSKIWYAKCLWLFSYYNGGMNLKDIALLTNKNLVVNRLIFVRNKTKKAYNYKIHTDTEKILMIIFFQFY